MLARYACDVEERRVWSEGPILPHLDFGDPECCGTIWAITRNGDPDTADLICNECSAVVRTVPTVDVQRILDEMESMLDVATSKCPHCGAVTLVPGFSRVLAFVCHECGTGVTPAEDPGS